MGNGERTPRRDGFTIVELLLVVSVLTTALLVLSLSMTSSMALADTNRETALAADAAREMIETLQGYEEFSEVYKLYNADPEDDPGPLPGTLAPGTAPGSAFSVWGLDPQRDDPDGMVGEIRFPMDETGVMHENIQDPSLGMPRDMNGDGIVEDLVDRSEDYTLLPVQVQVRWASRTGPRGLTVETFLADFTPTPETNE